MEGDLKAFKNFVKDASDRASQLSEQGHLSADIRAVLKDLLEITNQIDKLMSMGSNESIELRRLNRKFDTLKEESRLYESQVKRFKRFVAEEMIEELKSVIADANTVTEKGASDPSLLQAGQRIKAAVKRLIEATAKI
jgi:hypothetical protein